VSSAVGLTKRYGGETVVDDLSFAVFPGRVTGFLGPNGAGKSTTLRLVLGLARPDAGTTTVRGRPYAELKAPFRQVGAMLEAASSAIFASSGAGVASRTSEARSSSINS
jgi:ABC-2 type transport system ATP-binding protein